MNKGTLLLSLLQYLLLLVLCGSSRERSLFIAVNAFSPPLPSTRRHHRIIGSTTTPLFGLRTKAKEKIASILTRKLPRLARTRWQSVAPIIEKQQQDEDEDTESNVLQQRTSQPSSSAIATPLVLDETTFSPRKDSDDEQPVNKNTFTEIIGVEDLEKRDSTSEEETEKQEEDKEQVDLILTLPSKNISLVHLPPLSNDQQQQLTRAQLEFRNHFANFERYSQRDMALLKSQRLRIVLNGLAATPLEPAVYKSLEILYQDLMPLRYAGRFIFKRLENVMEMCLHARHDELQLLHNTTSLSMATLEVAQLAFAEWVTKLCSCCDKLVKVDTNTGGTMENDREHDLVLPTLRLFQSPSCASLLTDALYIKSTKENIQHLAALLDPQESGTIDFPQFVYGLQHWYYQDNDKQLDDNALNHVARNMLVSVDNVVDSHNDTRPRLLDPARQSYSDRFDEMLAAIREWQTLFFNNASSSSPNNHKSDNDNDSFQARRWQVLKGCCVGAENSAVREALRICYVDNAASRISGNIIFALVSAMIPKQKQ